MLLFLIPVSTQHLITGADLLSKTKTSSLPVTPLTTNVGIVQVNLNDEKSDTVVNMGKYFKKKYQIVFTVLFIIIAIIAFIIFLAVSKNSKIHLLNMLAIITNSLIFFTYFSNFFEQQENHGQWHYNTWQFPESYSNMGLFICLTYISNMIVSLVFTIYEFFVISNDDTTYHYEELIIRDIIYIIISIPTLGIINWCIFIFAYVIYSILL